MSLHKQNLNLRQQKKSISRFQLELSAFETTPLYQKIQRAYPTVSTVWQDFEMILYAQGGYLKPIQCIVTPTSIKIFKRERKHESDYIMHWLNGRLMELNGERFTDNWEEFLLWQEVSDWLRHLLDNLAAHDLSFTFLQEEDFKAQNGLSYAEAISFQHKVQLAAKDIQQILGIQTSVENTPYFSYRYWYTGLVTTMHLISESVSLHFNLRTGQIQIQGSDCFVEDYPQIFQVVKMLMKERAYGQVAKSLLRL